MANEFCWIESLDVLDRKHVTEPGRSLQDYYSAMAERYHSDDHS